MLRKIILFTVASLPVAANAEITESQNYAEFGFGIITPSDASTEALTGSSGGVTFNNLRANIEYEDATIWSLEYGRQLDTRLGLRVGVNYSSFKLKLKRLYGSGSYTYSGTTYNVTTNYNRSEISGSGVTFDNNVKILSFNMYKDFNQENSDFQPFLGFGLGQADIENAKDKEMAYSLILGVNYELSDKTYIGGRFQNTSISGPTDSLGVKYEDAGAQTWMVTIGTRF